MYAMKRLYLGEAILWLLLYLLLCYMTFTQRVDASEAIFAVGALFASLIAMVNILKFFAARELETRKEISDA